MGKGRSQARVSAGVATVGAVLAFVLVGGALTAWAAPPPALPASVDEPDGKWQPSFDYDNDGCYPTPAIGRDGTLNPGLKLGGAVNGSCHDASDLDNTNSYARSKCNNGWCAYMYALYFEKDQALPGPFPAGHRHDLEHVVVWVNDDQAKFVSVSQHQGYAKRAAADLSWDGTHAKVVYHKDGLSTHCFRFAGSDEQPENDHGTWQRPTLVSWNKFPDGIRDRLTGADFGEAQLALKNDRFPQDLAKAKPDGIPFDPFA